MEGQITPIQTGDDPRLKDTLKGVVEAEAKNAGAYDQAVLTLSSGALALSFAFIKDIIRLPLAQYNWLLYGAWIFFLLAIAANVSGFMMALHGTRKVKRLLFAALRHQTESEDKIEPMMERHDDLTYRWSMAQGVFFSAGAIVLTLYVMVNFNLEAKMANSDKPSTGPKASGIGLDAMPTAAYFAPKPKPAAPAAPTATAPSASAPPPAPAPTGTPKP